MNLIRHLLTAFGWWEYDVQLSLEPIRKIFPSHETVAEPEAEAEN